MSKLPRLDEVFVTSKKNLINVGSAYSLRETGFPNKANLKRTYGSNIGRGKMSEGLRPEFEDLVDKHYKKIMALHQDGQEPSEDEVKDCLRDLMHDVEGAEGEDPAELDQGGPEPGTTGKSEE